MALSDHEAELAKPPIEVGVRDLRDNLSRYLELVAEGVEVIVTNHGKAVAVIGPANARRKVDQLIAAGLATAPTKPRRIPKPLKLGPGVTVSDLVAEQRR